MSWVRNPRIKKIPRLCKIGLHTPGSWKTNVEPDFLVEVTLTVKRRYCSRCKAMDYREIKRSA